MRLAAGVIHPVRPEAAALVGTSCVDPAEVDAPQEHPIAWITGAELDRPGGAERLGIC